MSERMKGAIVLIAGAALGMWMFVTHGADIVARYEGESAACVCVKGCKP